MALSIANLIQTNAGTIASASSGNATLPTGTTAGNRLLIATLAQGTTVGVPAGFDEIFHSDGLLPLQVFYKAPVTAGETSWTLTMEFALSSDWIVWEVSGTDPNAPLAVPPAQNVVADTNITTLSTGTSPFNDIPGIMAVALHGAHFEGGSLQSWSGQTNGFTEAGDVSVFGPGNAASFTLAASYAFGDTGTYECTATISASSATADNVGAILLLRETITEFAMSGVIAIAGG